jgi:MoxR-like ATPase
MQGKHSQIKPAAIRSRMQRVIGAVSKGMLEREETVAVALLAALSGQNTFLYGPPGTAKSLISRRIACAFEQPAYFEYLMNRFSTPEEVFGPVSIKALKEDRYLRKTESYLPQAEFAFLDEIWKSSPAILNTLLTLINEHTFKNGDKVEPVPLKALIAASNETPPANQGLEALFDRFIVRLMVAPIANVQNFEQLLNSRPGSAEVAVPADARIRAGEWNEWRERIHAVTLSPETVTIIHLIRGKLEAQRDTLGVYVSDRRWQRAAYLMRAAAFFNGRAQTNHSDALLLQHCLWTQQDNHAAVKKVVEDAVREVGFESGISLAELDAEKTSLGLEINDELFYSSDIYNTEKHRNGEDVFKVRHQMNAHNSWQRNQEEKILFLPARFMNSSEKFSPLDQAGNQIDDIVCTFGSQGSCELAQKGWNDRKMFRPTILFKRGDKKSDINERLVLSLSESVSKVKADLSLVLKEIEAKFGKVQSELASLFVPAERTVIAAEGMQEQIANLKLRIKDCERLEGMCK